METQDKVLTLQTTIDADMMAAIERCLRSVMYERLLQNRARFFQHSPLRFFFSQSFNKVRNKLVVGLSLIGLTTTLASVDYAKLDMSIGSELWYAVFFACMLPMPLLFNRLDARARHPMPAFYQWMTSVLVNKLIGGAKNNVPFAARYEITENRACYARVCGDSVQPVWQHRTLYGVRMTGNGFTLLFKTPTSTAPHLIMLHGPSAQFEELLDRIGVPAIQRQ